MKFFLLLLNLFIVASCTTVLPSIEPQRKIELTPELNSKCKKDIGENLVYIHDAFYYEAINLKSAYQLKISFRKLNPGIYILKSKIDGYALYFSEKGDYGIAISQSDNSVEYFYQANGGIKLIELNEKIEYEKTISTSIDNPYFYQEFIYNGKSGNTLKFTYREFTNYEIAKPAFTQDLMYDISESKIIGCKGLRLEILSTSNTEIEYKLLKYFNPQ